MKRINIDRRALRMAIVDAHGFVQRAARALGVHRLTLMRRLREAGLELHAQRMRRATGWKRGPGTGYGI